MSDGGLLPLCLPSSMRQERRAQRVQDDSGRDLASVGPLPRPILRIGGPIRRAESRCHGGSVDCSLGPPSRSALTTAVFRDTG
jgi:hypothetical protein